MNKKEESIPCPSCGFLTCDGPDYGSYGLCPVCDWEDDAVQLNNPASGGGANKESLIESQEKILIAIPLEIAQFKNYVRSNVWRPITVLEIEGFKNEQKINHWYNKGFTEPKYAYWNRNPNHSARKLSE